MKRYIDFVQKPKKGQQNVEEETAFVSVPEKKPARPASVRPASVKPTASAQTTPVKPAPVRPHYKPDFGPVRKKPLGAPSTARPVAAAPAAVHSAPAAVRPTATLVTSRPASTTVQKPKRPTMDMARPAVRRPAVAPRLAPKPAQKPAPKPVEKPVEKSVDNSVENDFDSIFGIIEDYHPVSNQPPEIKKRPLSNGEPAPRHFFSRKPQTETKEAQAAEVIKEAEVVEQPKKTIPKTPFIRTAVEKRPLSNNFTPKKPAAPVKEPSDPATIIEKPEKDAHVGIIVTVVLTIVFGAALGTAAFLLLSK